MMSSRTGMTGRTRVCCTPSAPLRASALAAWIPLTYARSWHSPLAPCSYSPMRTQSPAHTRLGTAVCSGGLFSKEPGENLIEVRGSQSEGQG